jgi:predicted DNA-binding transcriptional regulator AlpA
MSIAPMIDLIGLAEIQRMLGVSRTCAYTISVTRDFPEPVMSGRRFRVWRRNDVEAWLDLHRPSRRGQCRAYDPNAGRDEIAYASLTPTEINVEIIR